MYTLNLFSFRVYFTRILSIMSQPDQVSGYILTSRYDHRHLPFRIATECESLVRDRKCFCTCPELREQNSILCECGHCVAGLVNNCDSYVTGTGSCSGIYFALLLFKQVYRLIAGCLDRVRCQCFDDTDIDLKV